MVVLTYHKVRNVKSFEKQINYLVHSRFNILSLAEFVSGYAQRTLKDMDVLITFDDGDYSLMDDALPILKKYNCPAVVFVITELIGTDRPFWWDEIEFYTSDKNRVREAKQISNSGRIELIQSLRKKAEKEFKYRQLTLEELKVMERDGMAIANHSHTHPMIDKLETKEIEAELIASMKFLKDNDFSFHDVFAYPNGNWSDQSETVLKSLEVRLAFLFDHKLNVDFDKPYRISRLSVNDTTPLWKFKFILSGLHSKILPLTIAANRILRGR